MPEMTPKMSPYETRRGPRMNYMMIRTYRLGIEPNRRKEIFVTAFDLEIRDIICNDFSDVAQREYPRYVMVKGINKMALRDAGVLDIQYDPYDGEPLEETKVLG